MGRFAWQWLTVGSLILLWAHMIFMIQQMLAKHETTEGTTAAGKSSSLRLRVDDDSATTEVDESYFIVFSTGCSEFQDWQSISVFSSAEAVGQKGIIVRIASGCNKEQEEAIRRAMLHLPKRCRAHFAPNTKVRDHRGDIYKYANKPLGMMHWLLHAEEPVPPSATVALVDPDMFLLRPLWHDSFDAPHKWIVSGTEKQRGMMPSMPKRLTAGNMIAQRYGIGSAPWATGNPKQQQQQQHNTKKKQQASSPLPWDLQSFFEGIGRPNSPALADEFFAGGKKYDAMDNGAASLFSIGAPYIALANDWLPIASNWTGLMPMAVQRNFGNLAEMYAMVIAVADYGIRPVMIDSLMVSDVRASGEGWPWVDKVPMNRGCDPSILADPAFMLPTFLHYCQRYEIEELKPAPEPLPTNSSTASDDRAGGRERKHAGDNGNRVTGERGAFWMYSKYQVPDEILGCSAAKAAVEGQAEGAAGLRGGARSGKRTNMRLVGEERLLPVPSSDLAAAKPKPNLRNIFAHCMATIATNRAARDYRRWFCQ